MDRFSSLRYPVHTATQPLDKAFPELFKYGEFKKLRLRKSSDWEKVAKYIVFLYDKGSALTFEFQSDLKARKEAAAIEAGFTREASGNWPKEVVAIFEIDDADVHGAIMCYLRIQNNDVWTDIVVTENELEEFQALRMTTIKKGKAGEEQDIFDAAKKKDLLMKACDTRVKALKNRYAEFYGDHKDVQAAEFSEMITPENALKLLAGTKPWQEVEPVTETAVTESVS